MIICGLMMDVLVLMVFAVFALKGTTWRIVIAITSFQVVKYLCAVISNLKLSTLLLVIVPDENP